MTSLWMHDSLVAALQRAGYQFDESYLGVSVWLPEGKPMFFCTWQEVGAFLIGVREPKTPKEVELAERIVALERELVAVRAERDQLLPSAQGYADMARLLNAEREENRRLLKYVEVTR